MVGRPLYNLPNATSVEIGDKFFIQQGVSSKQIDETVLATLYKDHATSYNRNPADGSAHNADDIKDNTNGGSVQDFIDANVTNNVFNALNPKYNIKNDANANADVGFAMLVEDLASVTGGVMLVPAGKYLVKHIDLVTLAKSNIEIRGEGKGITIFIFDASAGRTLQTGYPLPTFARNNSADGLFYISADVSSQTDDSLSVKNIKFRDLTIDMNVSVNGFDELMHAISAFGVSGFDVQHCEFLGFLGDGVAVNRGNGTHSNAYNKNVTIENNIIDGVNKNNRNGVSIYYCDGYSVRKNVITRTTRPDMPGAIDIEPDTNSMQTNSGYIGYNLIEDVGGNVGAITVITKSGGKTTTGIEVVGNNLVDVRVPFAVLNTGGIADNDPLIKFKLNTITGYSGTPFVTQNTRDILFSKNAWRGGTKAVAANSVINSKNIKISGGTFDTMVAQDGIVVDSSSSHFEIDGVEFKNMAKHAATINYNNSSIKVNRCKFTSTAIAATPIKTGLLTMPSAEYTEFSENVSSGGFSDFNEKVMLTLFTSSGVYPTNYNSMLPSQFPYGETVFYSSGATPEPFGGDSNAVVETVRDKYSPTIMTVKQTVTLRDPTATAYYQRFAASNTTWHPFKKVSLVSL